MGEYRLTIDVGSIEAYYDGVSPDIYSGGDLFDPSQDAWIESVYIVPGYRRNGYGSSLLQEFVEFCMENGVRRIVGLKVETTSAEQENGLNSWYYSNGFYILIGEDGYEYVVRDLR